MASPALCLCLQLLPELQQCFAVTGIDEAARDLAHVRNRSSVEVLSMRVTPQGAESPGASQRHLNPWVSKVELKKAGKVREVLITRDRRVGGCWDNGWVGWSCPGLTCLIQNGVLQGRSARRAVGRLPRPKMRQKSQQPCSSIQVNVWQWWPG